MFEPLAFKKRPERVASRIRGLVRTEFTLPDEAFVVVHELACSEPGCPPVHTAIFIFWPDSVEKYKLQKAMSDVTAADVQELALTQRLPKPDEEITE